MTSPPPPFTGLAFGRVLESPFDLSLPDAPAPPTLRVVRERLLLPPEPPTAECETQITADGLLLRVLHVGAFLLANAREIVVDPDPGVPDELVAAALLGPVMASHLHLQGLLVLHGAALATSVGAILLLGDSGIGKSTLAAHLSQRGHPILSDDILPIQDMGGIPHLLPAPPFLRLWPDAAESLHLSCGNRPRVEPGSEKRLFGLDQEPAGSMPIHTICLLERGRQPRLQKDTPAHSVMSLVRQSFCVRLLNAGEKAAHLKECGRLAGRVDLLRLILPDSLSRLPLAVDLLEKELATDA